MWLFQRAISYVANYQNELERRILTRAFYALSLDLELPQFDTTTLVNRLRREGLSFATKTLPQLNQAVLSGLASGTFDCPTSFRLARRSRLPVFLGFLVRKIFDQNGRVLSDACPVAVRSIRQICEYAYKADFAYSPSQISAVLDRFKENELNLRSNVISDDALLVLCSIITEQFFSDFDVSDLRPRHGPGVTSNVPINNKWDYQLSPNLPVYSLYGRYFFMNENDAMDSLNRYAVSKSFDYFRPSAFAKVILVPKDARGPRLISCEPCENQFIQQGIATKLVRHIETHPLTSGHVNFTSQEINRALAREASITGELATLDLKDASDLNSLALVEKIFRKTPLLDAFLSCRSDRTALPSGEVVLMNKFAPMGSALCFPVMAYVIYVLLYSSLVGLGDSESAASVYVYGDDIIVPTKHATYCSDILERYGFRVNRQKSFSSGHFRESCGGDFFKGVSVAPVRLRKIHSTYGECSAYEGLAVMFSKHANELSIAGLHHTAEIFYGLSEQVFGKLPFGTTRASYLHRHCRHEELESLNDLTYKGGFRVLSRAVSIATRHRVGGSSSWGHLYRVIGMLGRDLILPKIGLYDLPRRWKLRRGWVIPA